LPSNAPRIDAALAVDTPGMALIMETFTSERTCFDRSMAGVVRGLRGLRTVLVRRTGARGPPSSEMETCLCATVWSAWSALMIAPHVSQTSLMEAEDPTALCAMLVCVRYARVEPCVAMLLSLLARSLSLLCTTSANPRVLKPRPARVRRPRKQHPVPKMTVQSPSSLYSTHAARPRKRLPSNVLVRAVKKVLKAELSASAVARWHDLLDDQLGEAVFTDTAEPMRLALPLVKVWCPTKPRVARLLAQALTSKEALPDGNPVTVTAPMALGSQQGTMAKIIARRVVDLVIAKHADELKSCGELRAALFEENAEKHLAASMARHATDVLTYVAARAKELVGDGECAIIEMQTVDQMLHGRATRGSGLVVCEKGMALVERAAAGMLNDTTHIEPPPASGSSDDGEGEAM